MEIEEVVRLEESPGSRLERVFRDSGPILWRSVYAFTGGRRDITEEAVAEAFALAWGRVDEIRDPVAWIFRTAHRLALREMRRERRRPPAADPPGATDPAVFQDVLRALRRLSPMQRSAVVLHYEADLPVGEVASLLGISGATARVHLFRGRQHLRKLLGDQEANDV